MNALIMAGGSGSRFWPLSRQSRPKQFLGFLGDDTLLARTVKRLKPIAGKGIYIVTGREYEEMTLRHAPEVPRENLVLEPFGRNTAACIGLASVILCEKGQGNEVTVVCPADHLINDVERFKNTIINAKDAALDGKLVVIGIKPTEPSPHYGYIEKGSPIEQFPGLYNVKRFIEKPSRERAQQILEMGGYSWNAGIFLWTPKSVLKAIERYMPELYSGLETIRKAVGTESEADVVEKVYSDLPSIPIDIGVLERSDQLAMIDAGMDWCDVGNWSSLCTVLETDNDGNVCRGKTVAHGSQNCMLWSSGRLVAAVGIKGLAVVETDDAVLVCSLERDEDLKELLERLEREGHGKCR